ncbi:MAG: outer membrane beta-barrel protein [Thiolinea sp.]
MKYSRAIISALLLSLLAPGQTQAAAPYNPMAHKQKKPANNYMGASVGMSESEALCTSLNNCLDDEKSWKAYSGVRLNDNVVIEGGYVKFGDLSADDSNGNKMTSKLSGYTTAGLATFQYSDQIELFGKGGMIWWENETSGSSGNYTNDDSGTFLGVGANYDMGDNLGIKAEWERFDGISRFKDEAAESIDLLSVGVTFSSL